MTRSIDSTVTRDAYDPDTDTTLHYCVVCGVYVLKADRYRQCGYCAYTLCSAHTDTDEHGRCDECRERHAALQAAGACPSLPTVESCGLEHCLTRDGHYLLGYDEEGADGCYPIPHFYVKLPSGLRHWFESPRQARASQYWPRNADALRRVNG